MIFRSRFEVTLPKALRPDSTQLRRADRASVEYFLLPIAQRRREKFEFDDLLVNNPAVVEALVGVFEGLCGFCQTALTDENVRVHRWRPAQGAVSVSGETSSEHYYWLAYEWNNLYASCQRCTDAKGQKFPTSGPRVRVGASGDELLDERPLLLDPCADDAEQVLIYQPNGRVSARDQRGWTTIEVFALNRYDLIEGRRRVVEDSLLLAQKISRALDREEHSVVATLLQHAYTTNTPFAAVKRQFVNQRVQARRLQATAAMRRAGHSLKDLVGALPRVTANVLHEFDDSRGLKKVDTPAMPSYSDPRPVVPTHLESVGVRTVGISHITINNFKGLERLELDLASKAGAGSWTMLIGENGVGKTSILQAIALALAGKDIVNQLGVSSKTYTRRGSDSGSITVYLDGTGDLCSLEFSRRGHMHYESPYPVAVAGYGATRLPHLASAKRSQFTLASIANLFDPYASIVGSNRWIQELDLDQQASVLHSVHKALRLESNERLYFTRGGNLRLQRGDVSLGLNELSSGYQAVGALALDLARIFIANWDSLEAAEGLVLVDEIETHLHPRWQMQIVSSLRSAFPRVQFVATTHSPLCLRGLRDGEIRVLRSTPNGDPWIDDDLPSVEGLTADQLLTSEHFGLYSTLDEETQGHFERYYQLLSMRELDPTQSMELKRLQVVMAQQRQFGATRRERMMYEVIDKYLAKEELATTKTESDDLESSAYAELTRIWRSVDAQN